MIEVYPNLSVSLPGLIFMIKERDIIFIMLHNQKQNTKSIHPSKTLSLPSKHVHYTNILKHSLKKAVTACAPMMCSNMKGS